MSECSNINFNTNEPKIFYRNNNSEVFSSLVEVLNNTNDYYELGFKNEKEEFLDKVKVPIFDRSTTNGMIQHYIKNGYLNPNQIAPNTFEAVDELASEILNQELLVTNYNGYKRTGNTFEFGDFSPKVSSTFPSIIKDQIEATKTYFELKNKRFEPKPVNYTTDQLKDMIESFMRKIGFSFSTIDQYSERYKAKFGVEPNAEALIDLNNKIIATVDGKITLDQLSEEFSHFVIEAWNQDEINRMIQSINNTKTYIENAENYRQAYSSQTQDPIELERAVRKEVLGKMLAESLQRDFTIQNKTETETGFFNRLSEILRSFLDFFTKRLNQNLRSDVDKMATEIQNLLYNQQLEDRLNMNFNPSVSVMYSLSSERSNSLKKIMSDLNSRIAKLDDIKGEILSAFSKAMVTAEGSYTQLLDIDSKGEMINHDLDITIQSLLDSEQLLTQLRSYSKTNDKGFYREYGRLMDDTLTYLSDLRGLYKNIQESKEPIIVATEIAKKYTNESEETIDRILNDTKTGVLNTQRDSSFLIKLFGHLSKTSNHLVNLLSMVINDLQAKFKIEFMKDAEIYASKLISVRNTLGYYAKGIFYRSEIDNKKIYNDKRNYEFNILKEVFPDRYEDMTIDQYLTEFPEGNKPKPSSPGYYEFEYKYRKGLSEQKWESERTRDYTNKFIERIDSSEMLLGETPWDTKLFQALLNYEAELRKTNKSNKKYIQKILLENRRNDTNPFNSDGSLKRGFTSDFYGKVKQRVESNDLNPNFVVSTNPMFDLFKGKEPADSDLVFIYDPSMASEDTSLSFGYMRWNSISLKEAKSGVNTRTADETKVNFKTEYERKLRELQLKNLSDQDLQKELRDWLSDSLLFEATDEYWSRFETGGIGGIDFTGFQRFSKSEEDKTDMENKYEKPYKELQLRKQMLLKKYKQPNDYKEVDVKSMSPLDKTEILNIEEEQKKLRDEISTLFEKNDLEMYKTGDNSSNLRFNTAFNELFEEITGQTFIDASLKDLQKFFSTDDYGLTPEKYSSFLKLNKDLNNGINSGFVEKYKDSAINSGLNAQDTMDVLKAFLLDNSPVWYRRYDANTEYDDFIKDYNNGSINTKQLVDNYLNSDKNSIVYKGKELSLMQITPAFKFTLPREESIQELYDQYQNSQSNSEKYDLINRMAGTKDVDTEYRDSMSDITSNPERFDVYMSIMDAQLRQLSKHNMLKKDYIFLRPQERRTGLERFEKSIKDKAKVNQLKDYVKEMLTFRQDDLEESYKRDVENQTLKIPKYGFYRLKEDEITDDIFYGLVKGLENANHYEQRRTHWEDASSIVQAFNGLEFEKGKKPTDTNYHKMMTESIDFNFFGKSTSNKMEIEIPIMGQTIDFSKTLFTLKNMSIKFALAFSPVVAMTNVTSGITQNVIMRFVGSNIYSKANDRASITMARLVPDSMKDIGDFNPQSKINRILYNFGVYNLAERFKNAKYNKALRLVPEASFGLMAIGNFALEGQVALARLMDLRLIDGEFIAWRQYAMREKVRNPGMSDSEVKSNFEQYSNKSMYDYLNDDGTYDTDQLESDGYKGNIEKDQSLTISSIRSLAESTTMEIAKHHEGYGARDPRWSFVLSLKKWLVLATSTMFSGKRYDYELGGYEEGLIFTPKYFYNMFKAVIKDNQSIKEAYKSLDELEKKNIKTTGVITALMLAMIGLTVMLKKAADDDDDDENYLLQLMTYMSLRNLNETFSGNVGVPAAYYDAIKNPVMLAQTIGNMKNIFDVGAIGEEVKSGKYKGMDKYVQGIVKLTWLKNPYVLSGSDVIAETRRGYEHFNEKDALYHIFSVLPEKSNDEE